MKRIYSILLAMMWLCLNAHAGIYIGDKKLTSGVTYTSSNCKWIKKGSVLFEDGDDVCHIYMNNVVINTDGSYERGLLIETGKYHNASLDLTGENFIYSDLDALTCGANYNEVTGEGGSLEIHSSLKAAVMLQEFGENLIDDLRLWDGVTFIAEGKQAVATKSFHNSFRVSGKCNIWLKSTDGESSAVEGVQYFYLHDDMDFILPFDGKYDQSKRYMVNRNGYKYTGEVKAGVFDYLYIGDEPVSSWNWDHLKPSCLKSGSISYDHEEHVLTLDNATLEWDKTGSDFNVLIYFRYAPYRPKDFTIRLIGDNYLNLNYTQAAIVPDFCSLRIEGSGTLNIHSPAVSYRAMFYVSPHYPVTLACKAVKLVSESDNYNNIAFLGSMSSATREDRKLIIDNTRLEITSPEYTFFEMDSIIMNNVELIEPEGAYFDYEQKKIMVGDNKVVPHVVFDVSTYPVKVQGTQVTWKNKGDVLGDGTVSYTPESHTLSLKNAHLKGSGDEESCIYSKQEEFSINLQGKNTLTATESAIASTVESLDVSNKGLLTISGSGSLDIQSGLYGILTTYQNILIKDCDNLNVKAPFGIIGSISALAYAFNSTPSDPFETAGVTNSNVTVESIGDEATYGPLVVSGLEVMEENVQVVEPSSWAFKFPYVYDMSSGSEVKASRVVFKRKSMKGDVNVDGKVDISDIVAVINQIAGTATYPNADVNGDKKVDISDIVAIINIIAGM